MMVRQRGLPIWLLCVGLAACSDNTVANLTPAPPTISVRATSVDSAGALEITVVATNPTNVHLQVGVPPQCPLGVFVFPDPTGAFMMPGGATVATCLSSASTSDLAPGDSLVLNRTVVRSELAQYSPGTYGVAVTVVSKTAVITVWGGAVRLPLSSLSPPLPRGDGPLTGTWIQPSVDTWVQLDLSQSGTRVVGYYRTGSANFGGSLSDPISITGTAALPQATLQWSDGGQVTMNSTLSQNGDSLTGTWSRDGQPPVPFRAFHRSR